MDFMKVFDQTVREIKREVNLKVLKVPEIEQKVLDATDNEPWGPHGSALAEIAQATKKITESQMVMNVLWTRLKETSKDWRYVYKALAVMEYLVAHGSEHAVDDIIEHTYQISALSSFEYVEPSGKDMGINVRKKAENITALLNDKNKIEEVRNKAAVNRDKYFGLSSTGITYKSRSASLVSGSYRSSDKFGGFFSSYNDDGFRDSSRDRDQDDKTEIYYPERLSCGVTGRNQGSPFIKSSTRNGCKDQTDKSSGVSKSSTKFKVPDKPSQSSSAVNIQDEDDDFDPRGAFSKSAAVNAHEVDLFGGSSLIGDLMDVPTPVPADKPAVNNNNTEVDLFADGTFVSVESHVEKVEASSQQQAKVDFFASQPAIPSVSSTVDLFTVPDPVLQQEIKPQNSGMTNESAVDPFAAVPANKFDGSDLFGDFTSNSNPVSSKTLKNPVNDSSKNATSVNSMSKTQPKKDSFQVKSGIWADTLSRGLIDLNISAPKNVNLADVGIMGGFSDISDEKDKGPAPTYNMGKAMGAGFGLGRSGFTPSQQTGDDLFSILGNQEYQFRGFQK